MASANCANCANCANPSGRAPALIGAALAEIAETPPKPDSRRRQGESASPQEGPRSLLSLGVYVGGADDLAPGLELAGGEGGELLGRREVARAAQGIELGRGLGRGAGGDDVPVELEDDLARRAPGCIKTRPGREHERGQSRLRRRRHVGQGGNARGLRHRDRLGVAVVGHALGAHQVDDHEAQASALDVADGLLVVLVADEQRVGADQHLVELRHHPRRNGAGAVGMLAGLGLEPGRELGQRIDAQLLVDQHHHGHQAEAGDRLEVLDRIVTELLVQRGIAGVRHRRGGEHGVAVGLGAHHRFGGDDAVGAALVVDQYGLAPHLRELVGDDARADIRRGAGRKRHHEGDPSARKCLRLRDPRHARRGESHQQRSPSELFGPAHRVSLLIAFSLPSVWRPPSRHATCAPRAATVSCVDPGKRRGVIVRDRPLTGAWGMTALIFLFMFINFADKAVLGLAAQPLMAELKLSPEQFGLIGSAFFLLFPVSAVLVGFVTNRVAARHSLLAMAILWSLVQFPMLGVTTLQVLIASRIFLGIAEGPAYPVAMHAVYKWFPDSLRAMPTAVIAQGSTIGVIVAVPVLNWIIVRYSWHWAFAALSLAGLSWVVLWALFGREGTLVDPPVGEEAAVGGTVPYRYLLTCPSIIAACCAGFVTYWGLALTLTWFTSYLVDGLGYSQSTGGDLSVLLWLIGLGVVLLGGWISQ